MIAVVFRVPEWGDANLLEILWEVIGLVTFVYVSVNYRGARDHLRQPPQLRLANPHEERAAFRIRHGYLRREIVRVLIALIIIGTGLFGIFTAPLFRPTVVTYTSLAITAAFFGLGILTVVQSFLDHQDRVNVQQDLMESARQQAFVAEWESQQRDSDLGISRADG